MVNLPIDNNNFIKLRMLKVGPGLFSPSFFQNANPNLTIETLYTDSIRMTQACEFKRG